MGCGIVWPPRCARIFHWSNPAPSGLMGGSSIGGVLRDG
jgi:hypothetical protein